ncbi:unnamed protein product [Nesidiocoris tenuis]|uniref:RNA-directed DNA polymerase n=1 Tax=Nesidiocoris tenuis TaxID=355587 RepID=A0A6H5HLF0_9HEMI|nr:unnamed protein product [Nesidiocoris tenuis]
MSTEASDAHLSFREFHSDREKFTDYIDQFEAYCALHNVPKKKEVLLFISSIGPLYSTLKQLCYPSLCKEKTFEELKVILTSHLEPIPLPNLERHKFRARKQAENESFNSFLCDLKGLSANCDFKTQERINEELVDQIINGVRSDELRNRLLKLSKLSFQNAVAHALADEQASASTSSSSANRVSTVNKVYHQNLSRRPYKTVNPPPPHCDRKVICFRCGGEDGHTAPQCRFINSKCTGCGRTGHLSKVCGKFQNFTKPKIPNQNFQKRPQFNKHCKQISSDDSFNFNNDFFEEIAYINKIHSDPHDKIIVKVTLNGIPVSMEVDTGSTYSLMATENFHQLRIPAPIFDCNVHLKTYNNASLRITKYAQVKILSNGKNIEGKLFLLDGKFDTILGRDWLYKLQLDWASIKKISHRNYPQLIMNLMADYEDLFSPGIGKLKDTVETLHLKPNSIPVYFKARRVPLALQPAYERELERLESLQIISKVPCSEWATPTVPVVKADGSIRLCGDYKVTVNKHLIVDDHPIPSIDDILSKMANNKFFSSFDIRQAYLHMEVDAESARLLTINTSKGLYQVHRLMYGVASAPAKWQKRMDAIFGKLPYLSVFFDDISIASPDEETHFQHISEFFKICRENGIRLNKQKCKIMQKDITYLGHKIDENGLHKTEEKIRAILTAKPPSTIPELRSFLGLINYYGRFIPFAANQLHQFYDLLKKGVDFKWTEALQLQFDRVKRELASPRVLAHFDPNKPLILATDASSHGLGAVISHIFADGSERPIAFASRTLTMAEKKYPQVEKEALSIIWGLKKFFHYVYGRPFTIQTDHKPLTHIFNPSKEVSPVSVTRLGHYAIFLQDFNYQIRYRPTEQHSNADYFSRASTQPTPESRDEPQVFQCNQLRQLPVSADEIAKETASDPESRALYTSVLTGKLANAEEFTIQDGCVFRGPRVYIPPSLRQAVLQELHDGHLGTQKMKSIARCYVFWDNIDQDISKVTKECPACIRYAKSPTKVLHKWLPPDGEWQRIHVDHAGPFFNKYLLLMVDAYTKWAEVFIVPNLSSGSNIPFFRETFARYGHPLVVVSDSHTCFTSSEFQSFLKENGVRHMATPVKHPSSNGQVERFVQTIKTAVKKALFGKPSRDIHHVLQNFLLHYRKAPHCGTGTSPAQAMFGRDIRTRLDSMIPGQQGIPQCEGRDLQAGDTVAFRDHTTTDCTWITGTIVSFEGNAITLIQSADGVYRRHIDHVVKLSSTGKAVLSPVQTTPHPEFPQPPPIRRKTTFAPSEPSSPGPMETPPSESPLAKRTSIIPSRSSEAAILPSPGQTAEAPAPQPPALATPRPMRSRRPPERFSPD